MKQDILNCDCDAIDEDLIKEAKKTMLDENLIFDMSDFFKIFSDSTRVKMLWALDKNEMCVCDLAVLLNMTKSAISHQLRVLKDAKLVKYKKCGKMVYYSLADNHVKDILEKSLEHISEL